MAGWPTRITRKILGPIIRDLIPAPNRRSWIPDVTWNLAWWVLAGLGQVAPKAWFAYSGAIGSGLGGATGWSSSQPGNAKNGTGDYTFTIADSAADELGATTAVVLQFAKVHSIGTANVRCVAAVSHSGSNWEIGVKVFDADAGTPVDAVIFVEVF